MRLAKAVILLPDGESFAYADSTSAKRRGGKLYICDEQGEEYLVKSASKLDRYLRYSWNHGEDLPRNVYYSPRMPATSN